jgi:hypothetical protein
MVYSSFKINDLRRKFHIDDIRMQLFDSIAPLTPSVWLQHTLSVCERLPIYTEKAKSEWIIAPILTDVWEQCGQNFNIHSGVNLDADSELGLNGECDFILSADIQKGFLSSPIFTVLEAQKDDFLGGVPQCAAQLLGASRFNELDGCQRSIIYGCVTSGQDWLFMCLENNYLKIDTKNYSLRELEQIMGILRYIISISI